MHLDPEFIQHILEAILQDHAASKRGSLVHQLKSILLANLDRGRIPNNGDDPEILRSYILRVAENFIALSPYLSQLRTSNPAVWNPLFEYLQTWAYNYFLRKGFAKDENTREIAIECASEAGMMILNAHFPYDTEFNPWAHVIVQNACRKYVHNNLKKSKIPEDKKVELEEDLADPHDLPLELSALQKEFGDEVQRALDQLTEARRTVLRAIYFEEMTAEEVAKRMGKSVGAIYTLQFHGLQDLRKILGANRDNLNE